MLPDKTAKPTPSEKVSVTTPQQQLCEKWTMNNLFVNLYWYRKDTIGMFCNLFYHFISFCTINNPNIRQKNNASQVSPRSGWKNVGSIFFCQAQPKLQLQLGWVIFIFEIPHQPTILHDTAGYYWILLDTGWYCQILPDTAWYFPILLDTARYCPILGVSWFFLGLLKIGEGV